MPATWCRLLASEVGNPMKQLDALGQTKGSFAVRSAADQGWWQIVHPFCIPSSLRAILARYRVALLLGGALLVSGVIHLAMLWVLGLDWSGPLSPRKPGLFGVSAGITIWSIVWVLTKFVPRRHDESIASLLSMGLALEVGLITLQHWRGVPSHFNRETTLDAAIELVMFGVILFVSVGIAWLCWRSRWLKPIAESQVIALRAGLWLLLVSCGLGFLIAIAGEINVANGRAPETWKVAGVLKYPHGASMHAIQFLPLLATMLTGLRVSNSAWLVRAAVAAHFLFLAHALWQTWHGRSRGDVDTTSIILLSIAGVMISLPVIAIMRGTAMRAYDSWYHGATL